MKNADKQGFPSQEDLDEIEEHMKEVEHEAFINSTTLTKRERFAMAAIEGMASRLKKGLMPEQLAQNAVAIADALLKELEK